MIERGGEAGPPFCVNLAMFAQPTHLGQCLIDLNGLIEIMFRVLEIVLTREVGVNYSS